MQDSRRSFIGAGRSSGLVDLDRHKFLGDLATDRVNEPDQSIVSGRCQNLAVRPEIHRVHGDREGGFKWRAHVSHLIGIDLFLFLSGAL